MTCFATIEAQFRKEEAKPIHNYYYPTEKPAYTAGFSFGGDGGNRTLVRKIESKNYYKLSWYIKCPPTLTYQQDR
jgi:hypothetical protein